VKVLIVGSGGREHALAWKLAQSPLLDELHAAPGNPGIAELGACHPLRGEDGESVLALARELGIELVVVGPEAPLVAGVADVLRSSGIAVFGPGAAAARLEGSKSFAKDVLRAAGVPTAATITAARTPCVVKADGLAAGKGVWVCRTQPELDAGLRAAQALGQPFHVEELLEGEEVSVFALCDGATVRPLAAAQDYKRIGDGDTGPNTGGMGSFSPTPHVPDADVEELVELTCRPVLAELARRDAPFVGVLFAGLMLGADGPKVLEYNCRFGDPETQSILARLDGDLLPALHACATGDLGASPVPAAAQAAVTIVLATRDYPERGESGRAIDGMDAAEATGAVVFHAGTALRDGRLVTNGGRVLDVTATGDSVADARARAYAAVERISFDGMRYRRDIAELVHA
jgi:phosphoribosylamine--glycine ligase